MREILDFSKTARGLLIHEARCPSRGSTSEKQDGEDSNQASDADNSSLTLNLRRKSSAVVAASGEVDLKPPKSVRCTRPLMEELVKGIISPISFSSETIAKL